jgi:hypothetical protein
MKEVLSMRVTKTRRAFLTLVFILACSTAMAKPDGAAKKTDILSMMPDNSLAFVVINDPALLFKKAGTLAKQLEAPMPDPVLLLQAQLPAVEHVDMTRPAAVAISRGGFPGGGLILVPVTDFEAFVKACGAEDAGADLVEVEFTGHGMVAASYNGYAVLAAASGASAIEAVKNNQGKVAEEYAAMRERMEAADITGGVTRSGIETFAALAKQGIATMQAEIGKLDSDELSGMPSKSIAEVLSLYTVLFDEFDAAVRSYAFAATIEKKVIIGQGILRLKSCELATRLGQLEPSGTDWYGLLPAGQPVVVMAGTTPKSLMPGLLEFSKKAMLSMSGVYGMDEDQIHQLIEDSKPLMEKTSGMALLLAVSKNEDAPLYAGAGGILKVDGNAEQYIDDYAELVTKMAQAMKKPSGDAMFRFTAPKKIEVDGKAGVRIVVDFDLSIGADDSEQQQMIDEMMSKMYGPDGKLRFFLVAANDDTVAFGYTSQATVKRFMAAANGELSRTLGSMPAYKALRSHLPDDAQWGGAIDLGGYFELIQHVLPPGMVPDLDVPPSPIGFGVTASEQEVCVHNVVAVNTIKQLVQTFTRMMPASSGERVDAKSASARPTSIPK